MFATFCAVRFTSEKWNEKEIRPIDTLLLKMSGPEIHDQVHMSHIDAQMPMTDTYVSIAN
jgi:hypothetical protein